MIQSLSDVAVTSPVVNRPKMGHNRKGKKMADATETVELTAQEKALQEMQAKADATNKERSGKGTRVRVGQTRGRNPQVISWEAFDVSQPETLPATLSEFMEITKTQDEKQIVSYLVDGYNDAQYTGASDPIAEFVNPSWPDDVQKQFRLVVRNYSNATGVSLEDAVALIKPGIEKSQQK